MRKIKSFKLFESTFDLPEPSSCIGFSGDKSKIRENIDSCLVELRDKGFDINIIIYDDYINVDIQKQGDIDNDENFYEPGTGTFMDGYDEFDLYEIEDEVIQLEDYIKAKYDVDVEYIPETKYDMKSYYNLKDILPYVGRCNIQTHDLNIIRFDIYFKIKK